jgi:hypothetical protein
MTETANFAALVDKAMALSGQGHMRPVIEKELLHYDILFSLDKEGLLDLLTFQGGTSLRLCYGAIRFSEDLDFVGGPNFDRRQLLSMKDCLEHYIGKRYGLEVIVREPRELSNEPEYEGSNVDRWQIAVVTAPGQRYLPRQRIKIEVVNVPAYSRVPRGLRANYDFLPDGYGDTLVLTETLEEIMADKLISLVNSRRYVRHRDIWDLRWLKQNGAVVNHDWVKNKINDYRIADYELKLASLWQELPVIVHGEAFKSEMARFLPFEVQERTFRKDKFCDFLAAETREMLNDVQVALKLSGS